MLGTTFIADATALSPDLIWPEQVERTEQPAYEVGGENHA